MELKEQLLFQIRHQSNLFALDQVKHNLQLFHTVRIQLIQILRDQIQALCRYQDASGMWHTLIDDPTSYVESSATCGFGYGILKAVHTGLLGPEYEQTALAALEPILGYIDEDGVVSQVSYGTPMGRQSKDFYKNIELRQMPYGQALAMLFLAECLQA